ncbi:hypothetical protein [Phaeobacter sp. CAU 1743]|uniref:hypothetical protein n=1 Tax=Phaeobacter sp. CAU 1743 TaxID=3140367 RepID=UPI00325BBE59
MKLRILAPIVVIGFTFGFAAASTLWPGPSRTERITMLFKEICVARHFDRDFGTPDDYGLVDVLDGFRDVVWIDPTTGVFLRLEKAKCTIEAHAPHALSRPEAEDVLTRLETIVPSALPDLPVDPDAAVGGNSVSKGWLTGPRGSLARWGVFFAAFPDNPDGDSSWLWIRAPQPDS